MGFPVPHKYPRSQRTGAIAYAWWPKGRLVALEALEEGEFSTPQLVFTGLKLPFKCSDEEGWGSFGGSGG